jgi:CRP-like cAMP-binding protein
MPPDREVGALERIFYLKSLPPLEGLGGAELAVIAGYMQERFFRAGNALLREGDPVNAIHFVVDGAVRLRRRGRDLGLVRAGAPVGGLEMLAREAEGIEAVAEADTLTLALEHDSVLELFEEHFTIMHHMLRETSRRIITLLVRTPGDMAEHMPRAAATDLAPGELDLVERILWLRRAPPFQRSSINALAELSRGLAEVRFEAGTELWHHGEDAGSILLVVGGRVRCDVSGRADGFTADPGSPLGTLESVGETPRWYTARTETRVVALHATVESLIDVFEDNFEMAMDYMAILSRWLLELAEATGATVRFKRDAASGAPFARRAEFAAGRGEDTDPSA